MWKPWFLFGCSSSWWWCREWCPSGFNYRSSSFPYFLMILLLTSVLIQISPFTQTMQNILENFREFWWPWRSSKRPLFNWRLEWPLGLGVCPSMLLNVNILTSPKWKSLRIHHISLAIISSRRHSVKKIWEFLLAVNCPGTITLSTKSIQLIRFCV